MKGFKTKSCPVGCGTPTPPDRLMCLACWRHVDRATRAEVTESWGLVSKRDTTQLPRYRLASGQAIEQAEKARGLKPPVTP